MPHGLHACTNVAGMTNERALVAKFRSLPRYRFSPAQVRRICAEVVEAELKGKQWNGEEEAVHTVALTEAISERVKGVLYMRAIINSASWYGDPCRCSSTASAWAVISCCGLAVAPHLQRWGSTAIRSWCKWCWARTGSRACAWRRGACGTRRRTTSRPTATRTCVFVLGA